MARDAGRFVTLKSGRVIFIPKGYKSEWADVENKVKEAGRKSREVETQGVEEGRIPSGEAETFARGLPLAGDVSVEIKERGELRIPKNVSKEEAGSLEGIYEYGSGRVELTPNPRRVAVAHEVGHRVHDRFLQIREENEDADWVLVAMEEAFQAFASDQRRADNPAAYALKMGLRNYSVRSGAEFFADIYATLTTGSEEDKSKLRGGWGVADAVMALEDML